MGIRVLVGTVESCTGLLKMCYREWIGAVRSRGGLQNRVQGCLHSASRDRREKIIGMMITMLEIYDASHARQRHHRGSRRWEVEWLTKGEEALASK